MQKKLIQGIAEVPEICQGFDIDWSKYEAPGGGQWLKFYIEELKPIFKKAMDDANKEMAKLREKETRRNDIRKGITNANAIVKMIVGLKDDRNAIPSDLVEIVKDWASLTDEIAYQFEQRDNYAKSDAKKDIAIIEEDIKYLTAIERYFETDFELDATLWAMYTIEPKYKAKLFRHVIRLLPIVETNRAIITASNSVIKRETYNLIKPCIDDLDAAYAVLSKGLREMKKAASKGTPGFWEKVA